MIFCLQGEALINDRVSWLAFAFAIYMVGGCLV
jgi:NhaP-type Na+/H+ or K+/H+ antiporter